MRVLVAEDDISIADAIARKLKSENYGVDVCHDGDSAYDYFTATDYDVAVFDIMMPGRDGLTAVRQARRQGVTTPVLFLTARDSVADRVEGLDAGGDDYLIKPFAFEELLARLRVLTRRTAGRDQTDDIYTVADLALNARTHAVTRAGREINLTSREYAMLEYLIRNKSVVLSREQIQNHVWSYDYEGASNMVDVYIRYLRKKMDDGFDKKLIHTVKYAGYVLREDK